MAKRSSKTIALGTLPLMAAAFLAGCGEDEVAYCVDPTDTVVDNSFCDDDFDNTHYWAFLGAGAADGVIKGSKIKKASSKIAASNKAALAKKGGFGAAAGAGVGRAVASSSGSSSGGS